VTSGITWIDATAGGDGVATLVQRETQKARAAGRRLLVYVGAMAWCEPCQRFHAAVTKGELDGAFPALTLLAFDLDRDKKPLEAAGYVSNLIPLFVAPRGDGRSSGMQIQGSVKGPGAVGEISPRLKKLLDDAPATD
jgi:hypothetical protein